MQFVIAIGASVICVKAIDVLVIRNAVDKPARVAEDRAYATQEAAFPFGVGYPFLFTHWTYHEYWERSHSCFLFFDFTCVGYIRH